MRASNALAIQTPPSPSNPTPSNPTLSSPTPTPTPSSPPTPLNPLTPRSCLVPVDTTTVPCLYVFVDIQMDVDHMIDTVKLNFPPGTRLLLAGTIQFSSAVQVAKGRLSGDYPGLDVPKCKPLSPGEVCVCVCLCVCLGLCDGGSAIFCVCCDGRAWLQIARLSCRESCSAHDQTPQPQPRTTPTPTVPRSWAVPPL